MSRKLLAESIHRRRHRLCLEPLEPRLLLSADLLPIDAGVLSIDGTQGDDSLVLRQLEAQGEEAPQIEVILNGESVRFELEDFSAIRIALGGGNDSLEIDASPALEWSIDMGEGDNATSIRFGDGEHGARPPAGESRVSVEYRSGAGDDTLSTSFAVTQGDIRLAADMGKGSDTVVHELTHTVQQGGALNVSLALRLGGGDAGRPEAGDEVLVSFEQGDANRPYVIGALWNSQDKPTEDDKSLRLEIGSDGPSVDWSGALQGGAGNDEVVLDLSRTVPEKTANFTPLRFDVEGGAGDDSLLVKGTESADKFLVKPEAVKLKRLAGIDYGGFELLRIESLAGNDHIIAAGRPDATHANFDGGLGDDLIVGKRRRC